MRLYLYIDGVIMPCAPSSVSMNISGNSECILIHDGEHHIILSTAAPEALSVIFTIPDKKEDYENRDCSLSCNELVDFITARSSAQFELVLIGVDNGDDIVCDINMTVYTDSINVDLNDKGHSVTMKAKRFVHSGAL